MLGVHFLPHGAACFFPEKLDPFSDRVLDHRDVASRIKRFQRSLRFVSQNDLSLTSIAYCCGHFDQSHFIREFKSFTGFTPSGYARQAGL